MIPSAGNLGRLYGIGVGPGDPELITLKARRILGTVPAICVPVKSSADESYAYGIVRDFIDREHQQVIKLIFPMQTGTEPLTQFWEEAAETIWGHLASGDDCAFITEGDPFLYSTFIYVFEILRTRHPAVCIEVVPGVSSVNASAASALVPLAHTNGSIAILPATCTRERLERALRSFDTVVLLKVHRVFDRVLAILEEEGLAERAVCVARCSSPDQVIIREIKTLRGKKLDYFSLLIVRR